MTLAEHLQRVAATPSLFGVSGSQRRLQLTEELTLLLVRERLRLSYLLH
jgi:hypothetical protein